MKNSNKTTIDEVAKWYKTDGFNQTLAAYGIQEMERFFVGKSVLEIAPADGFYTQHLLGQFSSVTCIEASSDYCKILRNRYGSDIVLYEGFVEEVELDSTYDMIVCSHMLEHVPDPIKVLMQLSRWMHKDSRLIISVPNANSIHRIVAVQMGMLSHVKELNETDKKLGHYRVYDHNDLIGHVLSAGLEVDFVGGVFLKVLSNGQLEQWDETTIEGFYKAGKQLPQYCADILLVCSLGNEKNSS